MGQSILKFEKYEARKGQLIDSILSFLGFLCMALAVLELPL